MRWTMDFGSFWFKGVQIFYTHQPVMGPRNRQRVSARVIGQKPKGNVEVKYRIQQSDFIEIIFSMKEDVTWKIWGVYS